MHVHAHPWGAGGHAGTRFPLHRSFIIIIFPPLLILSFPFLSFPLRSFPFHGVWAGPPPTRVVFYNLKKASKGKLHGFHKNEPCCGIAVVDGECVLRGDNKLVVRTPPTPLDPLGPCTACDSLSLCMRV